MMKRFLTIALALLSFVVHAVGAKGAGFCAPEQHHYADTLSTVQDPYLALDAKIEEYALAIRRYSLDDQCAEADFLISTCEDSLVRRHVALKLYAHYVTSPIMGHETVAIHLIDTWFVTGKVKMNSDIDLMNARIFADFNRSSLIGMSAPPLCLQSYGNEPVDLPLDAPGRVKILYFYDTDCSTCRQVSPALVELLSQRWPDADLYAIYTGDNAMAWRTYRAVFDPLRPVCGEGIEAPASSEYDVHPVCDDIGKGGGLKVYDFWDPELDSGFQVKYGILQTPGLFVVDGYGRIAGRGLDTVALGRVLDLCSEELEYGSDASRDVWDSVFSSMESESGAVTADDVAAVSSQIDRMTLDRGDVRGYKQQVGDLLYYLVSKRGSGYKSGMEHVIDSLILSRPQIWNTSDDSLKVVGMAEALKGLLSLAPAGSRLPKIMVRGRFIRGGKSRTMRRSLSSLPAGSCLFFFTEGCPLCAAMKEAVTRRTGRKDVFFVVNMDEVMSCDRAVAEELLSDFDLSSMPYGIRVGRGGRVADRYITLD